MSWTSILLSDVVTLSPGASKQDSIEVSLPNPVSCDRFIPVFLRSPFDFVCSAPPQPYSQTVSDSQSTSFDATLKAAPVAWIVTLVAFTCFTGFTGFIGFTGAYLTPHTLLCWAVKWWVKGHAIARERNAMLWFLTTLSPR